MENSEKEHCAAKIVVDALIKYTGYNINQLNERIKAGKSLQLYSMRKGKTVTMSDRFAILIKEAFPELRYDWIRTGCGDMFEPKKQTAKPEPPTTPTESATSIPVYHNPDLASVMLSMLSKIEDLSSIIRQQNRQITSLSLLANEQKARLDALVDALAASTSLPVAPAPMPSSYHYDSLVADNSTQDDSQPIG